MNKITKLSIVALAGLSFCGFNVQSHHHLVYAASALAASIINI